MANKRSYRWLGAGIVAGVAATVAWFVVNGFWKVNGVGLLQRLVWPFSSVYVCAAAGAALGAAGELVRARRERRHARQLAEFADSLGFSFSPDVSAEAVGEWRALPVFQKWSGARNRLSGQVAGVPVEMLDYTYVDRGDEGDSTRHQTVVLLPTGESDLPAFELQPRTLAVKILSAMGVGEVTFAPQGVPEAEAEAVERFRKHYHLSSGLEAELARLQHREPATDREAAIREFFPLPVLSFFADHPGWHVQCAGRCLAAWRPNKIVAAADRPPFLAEALAIQAVLVESAPNAAAPVPAAATRGPESAQAGLAAASVGAVAGFFGGGSLGAILAGWIFFHARAPGAPGFMVAFLLQAGVFFGGAFGGLFLGLFLGRRFLPDVLAGILRRREQRLRARYSNRPDGQPLASTAVLEDGAGERIITLPPAGLVRGCGCFVFLWALLWNAFLVLGTPIILVAAFQGKVQGQGGQGTLHPAWVVLFLTPFWLIGLGSLAAIVSRGRRRARITASADWLIVEESTPFGGSRHEWPREKLADVRVIPAPPGRSQLIIISPGQPDYVLLANRERDELVWIAEVVREQLSLGQGTARRGA
jgi:hypothetical protein